MNVASVIAGAQVAARAAKRAYAGICSMVRWKRRMIAREELERETDIDGDGVICGVGNNRRSRDELRSRGSQDRNADAQRQVLDQSGGTD